MNSSTRNSELKIWKWLDEVLNYLGVDGMSSEESDKENHRTIYRIKIMTWHRDITEYMDMIDNQRHKFPGLYSNSGSKGAVKVRGQGIGYLNSTRDPVEKLPHALYNEEWFNAIGEQRQLMLKVSKKRFEWLQIHTQSR